jgi:tRNA-dependent cyclodipeptide synthase
MSKSTVAIWQRMELAELRQEQQQLAEVLKGKALEAAPPRGWDPLLFGRRKYRATVAQVAPARLSDTLTAEHRSCLLGISLGSKNSEGARFEACLRWVSENFDHCSLLVADSIYRYTVQVADSRIDAETARRQALDKGLEFIQTHGRLVEDYPGNCRFEFLPLSEVEKSPGFPLYHAELLDLYEKDDSFRDLVGAFADIYLGRGEKAEHEDDIAWERALGTAVAYLLEESALMCCLVDQGLQVVVYPGAIKTFQSIAEGGYPMVPRPLARMVFVAMRLNKGGLYFFDDVKGSDEESVMEQTDLGREPQEFLAGASEEDLQQLFAYTEELSFRTGNVIVERGRADRTLYIVSDGEIEVFLDDAGRRRQLATSGTGSVFGEQSFLDGQPRSATVSARTDCRVLQLTSERFEELRRDAPQIVGEVVFDIGRVLSTRLRRQAAAKSPQV